MTRILLSIFFLFSFSVLLAQKRVAGKVVDNSTSLPLEGASVSIKGNTQLAQTDKNGIFSFTASDSVTSITVSYVGFQSKEVEVAKIDGIVFVRMDKASQMAEVIVVGSRNISRTRTETPAPVDVIPVGQIINTVGQVDLAQILTYVAPSFQSSRQTIADGTDHIDPSQLRGLGTDQVLVLINGKRRHQTALVNVNGTFNRGQAGTDLSTIPASAIERIEVLRDGASAQYGSDAIAGVINIVLKKNTDGLSGLLTYGSNVTSYPKNYALNQQTGKDINEKTAVTDGANFQAALNYGVSLNKKGFLNLNAEYIRREPTNRTGTYTGQIYPAIGGVIKDDSLMAIRGQNRNTFDMRIGNSQITTGSFMLNSRYSISPGWDFILFGGYNKKNGEAAGFYRYPSLINSLAGIYRQKVLSRYPFGFLPLIKTDITDFSISGGFAGLIGLWNASITNTFGVNRLAYTVDNSINYTQFAVTPNPQSSFNAGDIKFLQNTINADLSKKFDVLKGLNVALGAEYRVDQYSQQSGEDASFLNYDTASNATPGAQVFAGFSSLYDGQFNRSSYAAYVDVEQDFSKSFLLAAALRYENYSDFGNTLNYKIAARYNLLKKLAFRSSLSTGFRAPGMQQRFYAKTNTLFVSTPTGLQPAESGTFPNGSKQAQILGIPELKQETSVNYSAGITATPFYGFEISVDAYLINIKDRIVLTNNFSGGTSRELDSLLRASGASQANFFTNAIDTRSRGLETVINYNFAVKKDHKFKLTLALTLIKNEVVKNVEGKPVVKASPTLISSGQLNNYFNREDQSRIEVASPASKGSLMATYSFNKISAMLRFAYFGKVIYIDPGINPANPASFPVNTFTGNRETLDQTFSGKMITDLSIGYKLAKQITFSVGANNLLNVYPTEHKHSVNQSAGRFLYSRRVQQMGTNGRYLFARFSFGMGK